MKPKLLFSVCLGMTQGIALASGSESALLRISTYVPSPPPPAVVHILDANKDVIRSYEGPASTALETAHEIILMEEAKVDRHVVKTISITYY